MSYDKQCLALAESFMDDRPHLREQEERRKKLAQGIQTMIDDWLEDWEEEDRSELEFHRTEYHEAQRQERIERVYEAADMERKRIREEGR